MPAHYITKHLQPGIKSDYFRAEKNVLRIGGCKSFRTARRIIQGFEDMLWLRKGFGFAGAWTVREQNQLLGVASDLRRLTKSKKEVDPASAAAYVAVCDEPAGGGPRPR